jgi:hypothetical protein
MSVAHFICVNINFVIILIDISNFVTSGAILFTNVSFGDKINGIWLSSAVLKGYSLFLIYKTNIINKLLHFI